VTLAQARRELAAWKVKAASRRRRLRFAREKSRLPWAKRKARIERFIRLVRTAERKVDELTAEVRKLDGKADARQIYEASVRTSSEGRTYVYGGGHGQAFHTVSGNRRGLDCSSSTWLALRRAGFMSRVPVAPHSSEFGRYLDPGPGRYVTVYYNNGHVWTHFRGLGRWNRFDTSPWGWGGRGPRVRLTPRSTRGFRVCHPRGC
jgi:hypothetical protein